jgi:hypothetical protein
MSLNQPQYNSTLKLIKRLDEYQANPNKLQLNDTEMEKINEKASSTLNPQGTVFSGLVSVEPDEEDFIKFLEAKHKHKQKVTTASEKSDQNQMEPDIMEFYPKDLIKEFPEVYIDMPKPQKIAPMKASMSVINDPIEKYFQWD